VVYVVDVQNGMNGLHLASKEGHINVVLELLARAASVDSSTKVNQTYSDYKRVLANISRSRYVAIATQPVRRLQIRQIMHN